MQTIILGTLLLVTIHPSEAQISACRAMFQQQKYEQAGDCFVRQAEAMGTASSLTAPQRWAKGRLLRNAVASYKRVAYQSAPNLAAWWREKALQLLQNYLQDKLFENEPRKKDAQKQITALSKEIGYATLQISALPNTSTICVTGYRFRHCTSHVLWKSLVRPGVVKVAVQATGYKELHTELALAPDTQITKTFQLVSLESPPTRRIQPSKPAAVVVEVISVPSGAKVTVNTNTVGKTPVSVRIAEAQATFKISLPCYTAQAQIWKRDNSPSRISVILERSPQYIQWQNSLTTRRTHAIWGWSVLAGGIVLTGFGITGYIMATERHSQANQLKQSYAKSADTAEIEKLAISYEQTANAGNVWRTVGHIGIGTGAAALGIGLGRILTLPSTQQPPCQTEE